MISGDERWANYPFARICGRMAIQIASGTRRTAALGLRFQPEDL
jgi:hypothetical protein